MECEIVSIRRCRNCQAYWYYCLREYPLASANYDRRAWYVRLTPEEAEALVQAGQVPAPARFADRPGFLTDEDGVSKIQGIPYFLE